MVRFLTIASLSLALTAAVQAADSKLDYDHQEQWKAARDTAQSPIDIVTADALPAGKDEPAALQFDHLRAPAEVVDNGHAVEVETNTTQATIRGRHFTLAQFHFHARSEHTLDGRHFPLEGHFVFKAQDGRLAVVAVMYDSGAANAQVQALLDDLSHKTGHPGSDEIDINGLLPAKRGYYHYLGSLTTPPLTENVEWYVLPAPVTMSQRQIDGFVAHYRHNNRNLQPRNGRPLIHYEG